MKSKQKLPKASSSVDLYVKSLVFVHKGHDEVHVPPRIEIRMFDELVVPNASFHLSRNSDYKNTINVHCSITGVYMLPLVSFDAMSEHTTNPFVESSDGLEYRITKSTTLFTEDYERPVDINIISKINPEDVERFNESCSTYLKATGKGEGSNVSIANQFLLDLN
jgi:uncharacterized protein YjhX (UPF0386 family)